MRQTIVVQAKAVQVGDRMLWDRPERTLWLSVTRVDHVHGEKGRILISFEFELPFTALEGLGAFSFYHAISVQAIDTDRQVMCLWQTSDPNEPLQIRREAEEVLS